MFFVLMEKNDKSTAPYWICREQIEPSPIFVTRVMIDF